MFNASLHPSSSFAVQRPLAVYGWDAGWAEAFAPYAAQGLLPGRVVRVDRGQCDIATPEGIVRADTAFVTPHDPLRVVCTGDWAAVDPEGVSDPRYVRTLLPRRTAFARSTSSQRSEGQILAANVDHAVITVSLAAELDLGRIERFLALAWESGANMQRRVPTVSHPRDCWGRSSVGAAEVDPAGVRVDLRHRDLQPVEITLIRRAHLTFTDLRRQVGSGSPKCENGVDGFVLRASAVPAG
ncbi:Putative ribosome biogenesis GTPase RsgA [Streptomyces venezuelae]|nr:Putative ribosome biogenesis GTPase RsgA [Streptomyces venezuelae]CUM37735.1 Probable GTPase related to EngC [Streptomyces venezuelae]